MKASVLILTLGFMAILPTAAGEEPFAHQPPSDKEGSHVFEQLLEEAKGIEPLLHTVTDKASAEKAASDLQLRIDRMKTLLKLLENTPQQPHSAQTISTQMSTLTRVTQGVLPTIQRLIEVNAYGSDRLLGIMRRYLANSQDMGENGGRLEIPASHLYEEMRHNLNNILGLLRKIQDPDSAKAAAAGLQELLATQNRLQSSLHAFISEPGKGQAAEELQKGILPLQEEIRLELERLQHAGFYSTPDIGTLLKEIAQP